MNSSRSTLSSLRNACHTLDCSTPVARDFAWRSLHRSLSPYAPAPPTTPLLTAFFSPLLETWARDPPSLEALRKAMEDTQEKFPYEEITDSLLPQELLPENLALCVPSPHSIQSPPNRIPECAVEAFSPTPSPFGFSYLSHLAQLRMLEFWGPTLDALAPAYKTSIWNISKLFREFGTNHDTSSFRKTISRWSQSPLENLLSIHLLFCAIGYLKTAGVLKHEFFYPSTGEQLQPVFRSEVDSAPTKKKRNKRPRSNESWKEKTVNIELAPVGHEKPLGGKLLQSNASAFKLVNRHKKMSALNPIKSYKDKVHTYTSSLETPSPKRTKLDTGAKMQLSETQQSYSSVPIKCQEYDMNDSESHLLYGTSSEGNCNVGYLEQPYEENHKMSAVDETEESEDFDADICYAFALGQACGQPSPVKNAKLQNILC